MQRQKRVKKHFDELAADNTFENREGFLKAKVFNNVLDAIIAQISMRFRGMSTVYKTFDFLIPKIILTILI